MMQLLVILQGYFISTGIAQFTWHEYQGFEYGISTTTLSLNSAYNACQRENSTLVDAHDPKVMAFIQSKLSEHSDYWIGVYKVNPTTMVWKSGFSVNSFCSKEPTLRMNEISARIDHRNSSFCIADYDSTRAFFFICQRKLLSTCRTIRNAYLEMAQVEISSNVLDTLVEHTEIELLHCINKCLDSSQCSILGYDKNATLCKLYEITPYPTAVTSNAYEKLYSLSILC